MELTGRKILVTGGSGGIGGAIAAECAVRGADVMITGRNEAALRDACEKIGRRTQYIVCNLKELDACLGMFDEAVRRLGGLDTLINNAGLLTAHDSRNDFLSVTEEEYEDTQKTNMKSVFFLCQRAVAYMKDQGIQGNILNIASEMGIRPIVTVYGMTKSAVVNFTRGLGMYYAKDGIVVNGIAPGPVTTKMMGYREGDKNHHPAMPNGRWACPEEIAELAAFLISPAARNIVGEVVVTDGGDHLK